ncbi:MAG: hypothetical protein KA604_00140 [Candidatus Saccharimonas sp.]|nr:hypothetical protein [Candidatus Saccharimonas sp.]
MRTLIKPHRQRDIQNCTHLDDSTERNEYVNGMMDNRFWNFVVYQK